MLLILSDNSCNYLTIFICLFYNRLFATSWVPLIVSCQRGYYLLLTFILIGLGSLIQGFQQTACACILVILWSPRNIIKEKGVSKSSTKEKYQACPLLALKFLGYKAFFLGLAFLNSNLLLHMQTVPLPIRWWPIQPSTSTKHIEVVNSFIQYLTRISLLFHLTPQTFTLYIFTKALPLTKHQFLTCKIQLVDSPASIEGQR